MIEGIIPPMVTPLLGNDKLDAEGLENLVEHLLSGGVHGLFVLGTTGEGPSLSYDLRYEVTEQVCSLVGNRVPVLVGITDTSFTESVQLSKKAAACGADAVVAAPPFYFTPNQAELIQYFSALADASPLPLFLYNMPTHTKVSFELETLKTLSMHANIAGFKDSSGNLIYFQQVVRLLKDQQDFSLLVGPEEIMMQAVLSGGNGGVNGGANMFPELYVSMYEAAVGKNFERMALLQNKIMQISSSLYKVGDSPAQYLQGVKCVLSLMGICSDTLAAPYRAFEDDQKAQIRHTLEKLNMKVMA